MAPAWENAIRLLMNQLRVICLHKVFSLKFSSLNLLEHYECQTLPFTLSLSATASPEAGQPPEQHASSLRETAPFALSGLADSMEPQCVPENGEFREELKLLTDCSLTSC